MAQKNTRNEKLAVSREHSNKKSRRNNRYRGVLLRDYHIPVNEWQYAYPIMYMDTFSAMGIRIGFITSCHYINTLYA